MTAPLRPRPREPRPELVAAIARARAEKNRQQEINNRLAELNDLSRVTNRTPGQQTRLDYLLDRLNQLNWKGQP